MIHYLCLLSLCLSISIVSCSNTGEGTNPQTQPEPSTFSKSIEALAIENLFRDSLALANDVEAVVSYLEVPANSSLPPHYHPGEEFVYLIEGSGVVTINDSSWTVASGQFQKIPYRAPHSFRTDDEPAVLVVFRAHEKGQPDRILIED